MIRTGQSFTAALHCTRPGNIFTTHTPVAAAFDQFPVDLIRRYGRRYAEALGIDGEELLALAAPIRTTRRNPSTWPIWRCDAAGGSMR